MRKYLLFSTIAVVFSSAAVIHEAAIDVRLYYFLILLNLPLFFFTWDFKLPKYYLLILAYVWASGFCEVALGPDTATRYLSEALGITVTSLYFYLFFRNENHSVIEIFDIYAKVSFWVSLFGIFLSLCLSAAARQFVPVKSVLSEPAAFATVVLPSFYYYASMGRAQKHARLRAFTILLAILLSVSSTGYLGLLLCGAFLLKRKAWGLFFVPVLVGVLFIVAYFNVEHFRLRVDDTAQSLTSLDVSGANLSTYAWVSNAYVAAQAVHDRPFFGYGVGGHAVAHARYIGNLPGADLFGELIDINAQDANSLFLRTLSEFGLVGVALLLFFLIKFWTSGRTIYGNVSEAVFVYFFVYLLRGGHWFSSELYFFVWTYVLVWRESRQAQRSLATFSASRARVAPAQASTA